jgi:hypothetical protein
MGLGTFLKRAFTPHRSIRKLQLKDVAGVASKAMPAIAALTGIGLPLAALAGAGLNVASKGKKATLGTALGGAAGGAAGSLAGGGIRGAISGVKGASGVGGKALAALKGFGKGSLGKLGIGGGDVARGVGQQVIGGGTDPGSGVSSGGGGMGGIGGAISGAARGASGALGALGGGGEGGGGILSGLNQLLTGGEGLMGGAKNAGLLALMTAMIKSSGDQRKSAEAFEQNRLNLLKEQLGLAEREYESRKPLRQQGQAGIMRALGTPDIFSSHFGQGPTGVQ